MKTFIARFIIIIPFIVTFTLVPEQASCRGKIVRFTLTTTTDQAGLKTAVPPHRARIPKIGLALAGGGAKAAASIGVLKVLEEESIPVAAVAGTSMGALVGGLYAAGYGPKEIERLVLENNWNEIFRDAPPRAFQAPEQKEFGSSHLFEFYFRGGKFIPPSGLTAGQKFLNLLTEYTLAASIQARLDFDRLQVPFRAVATDIRTGKAVVLDDGMLHNAIRASTAIPFVFKPVVNNGRLLVDGGLVKNLPVDVVRSMPTDLVIAVDASSEPAPAEQLTSLFGIMSQSITLQALEESRRQAALADAVILPDTAEYTIADFPDMQKIIARGEEAARAALPEIRALLRKKSGRPRRPEHYRITSLTIKGNRTVPDSLIRKYVTASLPPDELTGRDIQGAMAVIFNLGYFSDVTVDLIREGKSYRAVFMVAENPLVKHVTVSGNRMIPTSEIMDSVKNQIGKTLNTSTLASALETVVNRYRAQGYRIVRIERAGMQRDGETLEIVLSEGRVDAVRLTGQKRTKDSLFRREIRTQPDEPLNIPVLLRDIRHVYGLGYFEHLNIHVRESARGGLEIVFRVKEKPTGTVRFGLRYDLYDSFTGLTDITVQNWTGRGITLYLNTRYGNYADVTLGYRSPVFLRTRFVHSLQGFYRQRDYPLYADNKQINELDVSRAGAEFAFGYQWFKLGDTYIRYRYTTDTTLPAFEAPSRKRVDRIGSLAFFMAIDTRNSTTITHRGLLFKGSYESAALVYGGDAEYRKTYAFAQGSLPLGRSHTVALEAVAGLGSGGIPYHEKFGLGGADYLISYPLLGYERREFVGSNLLGFSAAYRLKIKEYQLKAVKAVYLNIAGGAANVWDSREAMAFDDLRKGGGIGLHADTLVGPFKLDFGFGEEDRFRVYFSAGFDF